MIFGAVDDNSGYKFFSALLEYVLPQVTTCSNMLAEQNIRRAAIDLCQKSRIWRTTMHPLPSQDNDCEYEFEPDDGADRVQIEWVTYDGRRLEPTTEQRLFHCDPEWPTRTGPPKNYMEMDAGHIRLWPTPNASVARPGSKDSCAVVIRISQRPRIDSNGMDTQIMDDYYGAIVNGALSYLMYMPGKEWSNPQLAQQYEASFVVGIAAAKNQAIDGNLQPVRTARYGGL